jgi:hypothetical protein
MVRSAAPLARGRPGPRGRPTDPVPRVTNLREAATCRRKPPPGGLRQPPPGWACPVRHYCVVKRPARSVINDHLRPGETLPGGGRPPRVGRTEHGQALLAAAQSGRGGGFGTGGDLSDVRADDAARELSLGGGTAILRRKQI